MATNLFSTILGPLPYSHLKYISWKSYSTYVCPSVAEVYVLIGLVMAPLRCVVDPFHMDNCILGAILKEIFAKKNPPKKFSTSNRCKTHWMTCNAGIAIFKQYTTSM